MPRDDFKRARDRDLAKRVAAEAMANPCLRDETFGTAAPAPPRVTETASSNRNNHRTAIRTVARPKKKEVQTTESASSNRQKTAHRDRAVARPKKKEVQTTDRDAEALRAIGSKNVLKRREALHWLLKSRAAIKNNRKSIIDACRGDPDRIVQQLLKKIRYLVIE